MNIMKDRILNKDTAFTIEEREKLHLVARYPAKVETLDQQIARCRDQFNKLNAPIEKWMYLNRLQEQNETLFCGFSLKYIKEMLPFIYTPTVGQACQTYSQVWQGVPRGFYFNRSHAGKIRQILDSWQLEPKIIVCTDGTRILGLGDLGTGGHHICVGKLALYTLGGGFHPRDTLPLSLDFGCNTEIVREDPHYLGVHEPRNKDKVYYDTVQEVVEAVHAKWPKCVFQFEDFSNDTAFKLLELHRHRYAVFNDDIQGTGCIAAACLASGLRACGLKMKRQVTAKEQRYVLFGAGAGGIGVADNIAMLSVAEGSSIEEARKQFYVVDSKGLITSDREDFVNKTIQEHKLNYVRKDACNKGNETLMDVIKNFKPTCLLGLSTIHKAFTKEVIETVCSQVEQPPIIFALSNPLTKCEITNQECYDFSKGKAFFASGSPFPAVNTKEGSFDTAQCNNFYCFPGIGLGATLCQTKQISDMMIVAVSKALAESVKEEDLQKGSLLPPIIQIRDISVEVARGLIREAEKEGLAQVKLPQNDDELRQLIKKAQWQPKYE